jgi:hypothetical protein
MAAGAVTASGYTWTAASNACSVVRAAATSHFQSQYGGGYDFYSCSADPVVVGTLLPFYFGGSSYPGLSVSSIAATADTTVTASTGSGSVTVTVNLETPVLNLSPGEGALIAGAVLAVWAVGWAFRVLIRLLRSDSVVNSLHEET